MLLMNNFKSIWKIPVCLFPLSFLVCTFNTPYIFSLSCCLWLCYPLSILLLCLLVQNSGYLLAATHRNLRCILDFKILSIFLYLCQVIKSFEVFTSISILVYKLLYFGVYFNLLFIFGLMLLIFYFYWFSAYLYSSNIKLISF